MLSSAPSQAQGLGGMPTAPVAQADRRSRLGERHAAHGHAHGGAVVPASRPKRDSMVKVVLERIAGRETRRRERLQNIKVLKGRTATQLLRA